MGEVGLDGAARVLWPVRGKHLYDQDTRTLKIGSPSTSESMQERGEGQDGQDEAQVRKEEGEGEEHVPYGAEEWKRLTPLKISMEHQRAILRAQLEVAVEVGIPVSLHCVAASGEFDQMRSH